MNRLIHTVVLDPRHPSSLATIQQLQDLILAGSTVLRADSTADVIVYLLEQTVSAEECVEPGKVCLKMPESPCGEPDCDFHKE